MLSAAFVGLVLAAEPCEAPRVHDVAPLTAAIAQDKAMAQGFLLAAGACATPGDTCTKARLECAGLLNTTALNQQNFDEGIWLRDMLLPYLGSYYPMGRAFPAAPLATDGSCNVDVSTLNQAGQRRASQATRRDGLLTEYKLYQRWADSQWQVCKDKLVAIGAKDVEARKAAEAAAITAAGVAAAAAVKAEEDRKARVAAEALAKQQQMDKDAALLREQQARDAAAAEQKRRELVEQQRQQEAYLAQQQAAAAEQRRQQELREAQYTTQQKAAAAEARRQQELKEQEARLQQNARDAAIAEQKRRESVEDRRLQEARDAEREKQERDFKNAEEARIAQEKQRKEDQARAEAAEAQRKKEAQEAEEQKKREAEAAARKAKEEEENKAISDRDSNVIAQKAAKQKLVKDAEDQLAAAREAEVQKKQAAVDAVNSSPAIASQLVAEAAEAEKARIAAEKNYDEAKKKAAEMVIDVSHERGGGSLSANFGVSGVGDSNGAGVALAGLIGLHFGFWGTAPMNGMASGFELDIWGRFMGQLTPANITTHTSLDALLTARYFFGHFGLGLAGEFRAFVKDNPVGVRVGGGPTLAVAFLDNHDARIVLSATYLPLANYLDAARVLGDFEISYKFLSIHALGGTWTQPGGTVRWQVGGYIGIRYGW